MSTTFWRLDLFSSLHKNKEEEIRGFHTNKDSGDGLLSCDTI